ncbi:MAG: putative sporulation protein YtxC [Clostridioides sp.]|nr:putative sporulation protein YtxC [Clostridioides sp.]
MIGRPRISSNEYLKNNNIDNRLIYTNGVLEIVSNSGKNENVQRKSIGEIHDGDGLDMDDITENITDKIIAILKNDVLKNYIYTNFASVYPKEINKIYEFSLKTFNEKEIFIRDSVFMKVGNYVAENDYLDVEGFIQFRLKEFMKYISAISDIALEEFLIERDHKEFIRVLRYFVENQDVKIDYLMVHIMNDNSFVLYNKNGEKIDSIDDEEIINMVIRENLSYEDFLISTLLSLCPMKIDILDSVQDKCSKEVIETLKSIFEGKVRIVKE